MRNTQGHQNHSDNPGHAHAGGVRLPAGWPARAVLFLLLLVVLDQVLYVVLDAGFRRITTGESGGIVNRVLRTEAEVYVLGSSRAWRHYDAPLLQERLGLGVQNAGLDGRNLPFVRGLQDLILRRHQPKLMIIEVDPNQLVRQGNPYDRVTVLAPFIGESPVVRRLLYARSPLERTKYLSRSFRYNSMPLAIIKNLSAKDATRQGYLPLLQVMPDPRVGGSVAEADAVDTDHLELEPDMPALVRELIEAGRAAGVTVVLATGPRWRANAQLDPAMQPYADRLREVARQADAPYLEFSLQAYPVFQDHRLFADPAHLNQQGAIVFTHLLADRLLAEGYLAQPDANH